MFLRLLAEMKARFEWSEKELKMVGLRRDGRDGEGDGDGGGEETPPTDDTSHLRQQLVRLREDIVLMGRAVDAGWDAAAAADRRLETEVHAAHRNGREEGMEDYLKKMRSLNESIELKEERITLMLVREGDMQQLVKEAKKGELRAVEEGHRTRSEALEAIAILGGSPGTRGGVSEEEHDAVENSLNDAHLEVVRLAEQCDGLLSSLKISRQKNDVMVQLNAALKTQAKANVKVEAKANVAAEGAGILKVPIVSGMEEQIAALKASLSKGTVMWKNNRKDDCFEIYAKACDDALPLLHSAAARNSLLDGVQLGRAQSMGGQKKERGCAVLKKTLERLLYDLLQPPIQSAEEEEETGKYFDQDHQLQIDEDPSIASALSQLDQLSRQEAANQIYCESRSIGGLRPSFAEPLLIGVEDGDGAFSSAQRLPSVPSTLLTRAVNAEARVQVLKRQILDMAREKLARDDEAFELSVVSSMPVFGSVSSVEGSKGEALGLESAQPPSLMSRGITFVNPAEMRKLQRRVRELEAQVTAEAQGPPRGQPEAPSAAGDKKLLRKMKDLQTAHTREVIALEGRAQRAEIELQATSASLSLLVADRDQLRRKVRDSSPTLTLQASSTVHLHIHIHLFVY
jgi:hypothetical protein